MPRPGSSCSSFAPASTSTEAATKPPSNQQLGPRGSLHGSAIPARGFPGVDSTERPVPRPMIQADPALRVDLSVLWSQGGCHAGRARAVRHAAGVVEGTAPLSRLPQPPRGVYAARRFLATVQARRLRLREPPWRQDGQPDVSGALPRRACRQPRGARRPLLSDDAPSKVPLQTTPPPTAHPAACPNRTSDPGAALPAPVGPRHRTVRDRPGYPAVCETSRATSDERAAAVLRPRQRDRRARILACHEKP